MTLLIFLSKDIIIYRIRCGNHKKHHTAKYYREHIYFVFKLGEPVLLGSKRIAYEYARISRYPWHMKNGIKNFREKYPGSIIILKMVNDPLRVWKKNHSITIFQCYFRINKRHDHILKVTEAT